MGRRARRIRRGCGRRARDVPACPPLHPGLDFRGAAAEALSFDDRSFDAAIGNFVVPHFGRPEQSIKEFVRILEPGGRLSLTTWDLPERARLVG
jgi:ubiquinone/menaquinone biosynthesis C-methylase UbiE